MKTQSNIWGESKLTGSLYSQLESVYRSENVRTSKELIYKWSEYQHGISRAVVDQIITSDRIARKIVKEKAYN